MVDIGISVALAVVALLMGYMGMHMTLHPPTEVQKRQYKIGFGLLSLLSVALIFSQGIRNAQTQSDLLGDARTARVTSERASRELEQIRSQQHDESVRREQAERDLASIVKSSGESTRAGISDDIKKLPSEPPKIAGIRCIQRPMTSDRDDAPFALVVTVQPDGVISPLAMEIVFDGPVLHSTYSVIGSGSTMEGGRVPAAKQENNIIFRINSPPVSPEAPVIARVYSKQRIRMTKCNYTPF